MMMAALGLFVFGMPTAAYQELQRQTSWRHASTSRIGTVPAYQFLGRGDETITLPGVIYSEIAGKQMSIDALRMMADTGKAWPLIEGTGRIYGIYVIESIQDTRSYFFDDGAARKIEFSITLKRIDDGKMDKLGSLLALGGGLLRKLL